MLSVTRFAGGMLFGAFSKKQCKNVEEFCQVLVVFQSGLIVFGTIFLEFRHFFVLCRKSSNCLQLRLSLKLFWRSSVDGQQMEFPGMIMTKGKVFSFLRRTQRWPSVGVLYLKSSDSKFKLL